MCLGMRGAGEAGEHVRVPAPRVTGSPPAQHNPLHPWVRYYILLHKCIFTLLNGSAELFKHPSPPPANNSLGKKEKNNQTKTKRAVKELQVAVALSL